MNPASRSSTEPHRLPLLRRLGVGVAGRLLRVYLGALRVRLNDAFGVLEIARRRPIIFCSWHNRMLVSCVLYRRYLRPRPGVVLTSPSRDGAYLDEAARHLGLRAVRGSSSRRGMRAMFELLKALEDGAHVGITPDGPRGPKYELGPGAVMLAQKSGSQIVPVHGVFGSAWRLNSWDGFYIPKPFSALEVTLGKPIDVPSDLDDAAFEAKRVEVEKVMRDGVARE